MSIVIIIIIIIFFALFGFSLQLIFTRTHESRGSIDRDLMSEFLGDGVLKLLRVIL